MNQKMQFVSFATSGRFSVSQLCEDFAISRKTGHKWLTRYAVSGSSGLNELSRRPQDAPTKLLSRFSGWS